MKYWVKKIIHGRNKVALIRKVLRKKSFRYLREAVFLIRHPFNIDLVEIGQVEEPLLIDIGAFDGNFATKFRSRYEDSKLVLIEPVGRFSDQIPSELRNCSTVIIQKGLTKDGRQLQLSVSDADTSSYKLSKGETLVVDTLSISELQKMMSDQNIDLLQINCEGGEYEIIPEIIDTGFISQITNLNLQFHYLAPLNVLRHKLIRRKLRKTHKLLWSTYFIWERWERK